MSDRMVAYLQKSLLVLPTTQMGDMGNGTHKHSLSTYLIYYLL